MSKFKIVSVIVLFFSLEIAMNSVIADSDKRTSIQVSSQERNLVLMEMRAFLVAVQNITVALGKGDMDKVAESAKIVGMSTQKGMPEALKNKLPIEFKKLGRKTHMAFDQLALDADEMEDKQQALEQLGALMSNCVACHATFRLDSEK